MGAVNLTISVSGVDQVLLSFNVIRIKRSKDGVGGTYLPITDLTPQPAELVAPLPGNYAVDAKYFRFFIDAEPITEVLFSGSNPLTAAQCADQINNAFGDTIAYDDSGTLRMTSTLNGTGSKVEIEGGGAVPIFGWADGDKDNGEDAHIAMLAGQPVYTFVDKDGDADFYYTAQFLNTSNGLESNDSAPFQGATSTLISAGTLSRVQVDLVDGRGVAVEGQEITFYPQHAPLEVEGFQVALQRAPITIITDNSGHAEVSLVRGLMVKVVFEGTSIIRDITIPDAADTDLLAELGNSPDPYDISTPKFPWAIRRTL
jgi:hypothetical protein